MTVSVNQVDGFEVGDIIRSSTSRKKGRISKIEGSDNLVSHCHKAKIIKKYRRIPYSIMIGFVPSTTYRTEWYDECSECGKECRKVKGNNGQ